MVARCLFVEQVDEDGAQPSPGQPDKCSEDQVMAPSSPRRQAHYSPLAKSPGVQLYLRSLTNTSSAASRKLAQVKSRMTPRFTPINTLRIGQASVSFSFIRSWGHVKVLGVPRGAD